MSLPEGGEGLGSVGAEVAVGRHAERGLEVLDVVTGVQRPHGPAARGEPVIVTVCGPTDVVPRAPMAVAGSPIVPVSHAIMSSPTEMPLPLVLTLPPEFTAQPASGSSWRVVVQVVMARRKGIGRSS